MCEAKLLTWNAVLLVVIMFACVRPTRPWSGSEISQPAAGSTKVHRNIWEDAAWGGIGSAVQTMRVRGGSAATTREQMEVRMKEERAKMAEEEERVRALLERKKRERDESNRMALVKVEAEEAEMQLVRKKRRRLPDVPTLEDFAVYGKEMLDEGDTDEAMLTYR